MMVVRFRPVQEPARPSRSTGVEGKAQCHAATQQSTGPAPFFDTFPTRKSLREQHDARNRRILLQCGMIGHFVHNAGLTGRRKSLSRQCR
jgi:hypothetical protein